jgi:DNA gyrase/topoisomerase IV subunit B
MVEAVSPFRWISSTGDVSYAGDGRADASVHQLVAEKWLGGTALDEALRGYAVVSDRDGRMEINVDPRGVPFSATYTFSVRATDAAGTTLISGTTTYRLSQWGSVEPIEPPVPAS